MEEIKKKTKIMQFLILFTHIYKEHRRTNVKKRIIKQLFENMAHTKNPVPTGFNETSLRGRKTMNFKIDKQELIKKKEQGKKEEKTKI